MIKVASYCRVSTDKEDQANSFEAQKRYFKEYIEQNPDWKLYEIYADEGISGTSTKKRTQFNRMMNDAYESKFQMIITKEVSRFSRNILDTIAYTRELRSMGIGVIFATDRINTLEPESEMLLSYMAALSQEESRRTSARVVWGQTRQMEKGIVFGRSMLGYDLKDGILTVNPQGAEIVRLIFHKYAVEQTSTTEIARFLSGKGLVTYHGNTNWKANSVIKILRNEKYVGDLIQKKTYTPDFLTHEKKRNIGQVSLIVIPDHHEPIVSRKVWNLAQERLDQNNKHRKGNGSHSNRYIFSGKIKCGECGSNFVGRVKYLKDGTKIRRWSCGTATNGGAQRCDVGKIVRDDDALQMLKSALNALQMDRKAVIHNVTRLSLDAIRFGQQEPEETPERIQYKLTQIQCKKEAVLDSFFSKEISKEDMISMNRKYEEQIQALRKCIWKLQQQSKEDASSPQDIVEEELQSILTLEKTSDVFCKNIVESLTVFKDRHMELKLIGLPQIFHFLE